MKIILLQDIKGVGKKDQIINASDGYAKNFLLPKKLGLEATKENLNRLASKQRLAEEQKIKELEEAKLQAKEIETKDVKIYVKTGKNGKLFGTITNKEVAVALEEQGGIKIDKKKITLKEGIKSVGDTVAEIKLHSNVVAKLKVSIIEK